MAAWVWAGFRYLVQSSVSIDYARHADASAADERAWDAIIPHVLEAPRAAMRARSQAHRRRTERAQVDNPLAEPALLLLLVATEHSDRLVRRCTAAHQVAPHRTTSHRSAPGCTAAAGWCNRQVRIEEMFSAASLEFVHLLQLTCTGLATAQWCVPHARARARTLARALTRTRARACARTQVCSERQAPVPHLPSGRAVHLPHLRVLRPADGHRQGDRNAARARYSRAHTHSGARAHTCTCARSAGLFVRDFQGTIGPTAPAAPPDPKKKTTEEPAGSQPVAPFAYTVVFKLSIKLDAAVRCNAAARRGALRIAAVRRLRCNAAAPLCGCAASWAYVQAEPMLLAPQLCDTCTRSHARC